MAKGFQCDRCQRPFAGAPKRRITNLETDTTVELCEGCDVEFQSFMTPKPEADRG